MDVKSLADQLVSSLITVEKPVMPPKAKWLGNLKKYTPITIIQMLSVMMQYSVKAC